MPLTDDLGHGRKRCWKDTTGIALLVGLGSMFGGILEVAEELRESQRH